MAENDSSETTKTSADAVTYDDKIRTTTTVHLSFIDSLKTLVGYPLLVAVNVETENVVGATRSSSRAWTPPVLRGYSSVVRSPEDLELNSARAKRKGTRKRRSR